MDIQPIIKELCVMEDKQDGEEIKEKWLYLILKWLYKNRSKYEDPLEIVEELYEEFEYPENMKAFVRYMPSDSGDLGSLELNRERLYKNWKKYLVDFEEEKGWLLEK